MMMIIIAKTFKSVKKRTLKLIYIIKIGALSNIGAQEIGKQYHSGNLKMGMNGTMGNVIGKTTQLTLHAGLGALSNKLTGNDVLSGAVSGVSGEILGDLIFNSLNEKYTNQNTIITKEQFEKNKNTAIELAGLGAGLSALIVGKIKGLDSQDIGNNMFAGQMVGKNAAQNNSTNVKPLLDKDGNIVKSKYVVVDVKNFIPNTLNATIGALNTTSMILEKVLPSAPQTKFIQNEDGTYTVEPIFPKGPLGTALKYTAFVWNSPNTAIGLTAGALGTLGGAEFGKFDWDNLVFSVNNYPVGGGAITLGNVIIYSGVKENQTTYTYDFNHRQSLNPKLRATNNDKTTFKQHEYPHVEQSYILGPFYLPVYLLSGGVGHWNWMEKQADKKGNKQWKKDIEIKK